MSDSSDKPPPPDAAAPPGAPRLPPFVPASALRTMVNSRGLDVLVQNAPKGHVRDAYYNALHIGWGKLLGLFALVFIAFNLSYATLYALDPHGLVNTGRDADVPRFWRDFFFSVHTLATIGYGNVYPQSLYTNILVTAEAITGLLLQALVTGLVFARFARPTARILFSDVAVVTQFEGVPTIQLRTINQRHNLILEANARASLLRITTDDQGYPMRRFLDLKLVRSTNPVFALSWTVMHKIEPDSPFYGMTPEQIAEGGDEIIVVISGIDQSMAQTIHGRSVYTGHDIRWNARFVDILAGVEDGRRVLDYGKFHEVEEL